MALLAETGARGPVSRTTLGIVLVSDIVVVLVFSMALAFARSVAEPSPDAVAASLTGLLWEIGGSPVVGVLLGLGISLYLRYVGQELMLFAVVAVFLGLELTQALHVETHLTLLVAGIVVENTSVEGDRLRASMARSAAPLFVVFFALSGARIDVAAVASAIPVVLTLALLRAGSIAVGTHVGGRWAGAAPEETRLVWMGLVSQAGVAIGLTAVLAEAYPVRGLPLASLLLAIIAVNELVGPVLFRRALVRSGEAT
jgi:Kef-type K+ transport system membrane component KefB